MAENVCGKEGVGENMGGEEGGNVSIRTEVCVCKYIYRKKFPPIKSLYKGI